MQERNQTMKGYFPTLAKYALGQDTKIKKQCKFKYYRNTDASTSGCV